MGSRSATGSIERRLAALAERQGGVVSRAQCVALGLGDSAIDHRLQASRLHVVFRGVYAVGHRGLTRGGMLRAAVLAAGDGAVLSHDSAAEWWGLQEQSSQVFEVTVPTLHGRSPSRLRVHRTSYLPPLHITRRRGIPITTVERTILDRAARRPLRGLQRDIDEAYRLRLFNKQRLQTILEECKGRAGTATLRAVLKEHTAGTTWTRNDFEEALFILLDQNSLPCPIPNDPVGPYVLDFHWPDRGLAVECDGRDTHFTPKAFEGDRARDTDLWVNYNIHVIRFTFLQVTRERAVTLHRLKGALRPPTRS